MKSQGISGFCRILELARFIFTEKQPLEKSEKKSVLTPTYVQMQKSSFKSIQGRWVTVPFITKRCSQARTEMKAERIGTAAQENGAR